MTPNEKIVSEEQEKRFHELNGKPENERTEEERQELQGLKDQYAKSAKDRIDELTKQKHLTQAEKAELQERLEKTEAELAELKAKKPEPKVEIKRETVEIAGNKYYTDEALWSMIEAKELTQAEAERYAKKRDKEEIKQEIREENASIEKKRSEKTIRLQDKDEVLKVYPQFNPKHPDHNPEDPLYKTANEIYKKGYHANPRGLSEAIKDAKRILRMTDTHTDRSDDLSLEETHIPTRSEKSKEQEVKLEEWEKEQAIRQYTLGAAVNPKTQRPYTEKEALAKALEAKKRQMSRRIR